MTTGTAVVSYNVYDNWYATGSNGKVGANYGRNYGAHCVLIVGWTKNNEWIILNSWGRSWGDNGLGYVPMSTPKNETWSIVDTIQEIFFKSLKDVETHWAKTSIDKAVTQGVLTGYEDGTFRPDEPITRAEACAIVAKLDGYEGREYYSCTFSDVSQKDWFYNYVVYCYTRSRIAGYPDGTFMPYNNLTRAEACKVLALLGKINVKPEINGSRFVDVDTKHWACRFINAMYDGGYINGYEDGSFKPESKITRAEFITIIDRLGLLNR